MPLRTMRLLLALALLAASACDTAAPDASVDVQALSHDPADLVGTWDLTSVTVTGDHPQGPVTYAPDAWPHGARTLAFRADGTVDVDGLPSSYAIEDAPWGGETAAYLHIGERAPVRFGVDGDRFYTDAREVDGEWMEYARREP